MKFIFTFLWMVLIGNHSYAQFGPKQVISDDAQGAQSVFAIDIDGDADLDVLVASQFDDTIAWYENTDGLGLFGAENIIASLDQTRAVYGADLDGDNDTDVLAVAGFLDLVVWYENLDGQGNFGAQQIISNVADSPIYITAADIDGDMDLDVISGSSIDDKIAWYENTDGNGSFGPEQIISLAGTANGRSISAVDLDGDLDLDIVTSASGSSVLSWFENLDGQGNFGPNQTISTTGLATTSVFSVDIDGDDDIDILSAVPADDIVAWYENLDGQGNFGGRQIITSDADFAIWVFGADLDNDNDIDVISASALDDKIAWYENTDGQGSFGPEQVLANDAIGATAVFAADLDNDTDIDVLSASQNDDTIAWYENLKIFGIEDYTDAPLVIYPNPSEGVFHINLNNDVIIQIDVYNLLGERIRTQNNGVERVDISDLPTGVYLLKVNTENGQATQRIIKE